MTFSGENYRCQCHFLSQFLFLYEYQLHRVSLDDHMSTVSLVPKLHPVFQKSWMEPCATLKSWWSLRTRLSIVAVESNCYVSAHKTFKPLVVLSTIQQNCKLMLMYTYLKDLQTGFQQEGQSLVMGGQEEIVFCSLCENWMLCCDCGLILTVANHYILISNLRCGIE